MNNTSISFVALGALAAAISAQQPAPSGAAPLEPPTLELRLMATDGDTAGGQKFDLAAEQARLRAWLNVGANRESLRANPRHVDRFHALGADRGGPQNASLRWFPRLVRPSVADITRWDMSYARLAGSGAVPLFSDAEYQAGPTLDRTELVEMLPVNMRAPAFGAGDLEASSLSVDLDADMGPTLLYQLKPGSAERFKALSAANVDRALAIIVDGFVRSAPVIRGAIAGRGAISGNFSVAEVRSLERALRDAAGAAAPQDTLVEVDPSAGDALPASADPADLRAMQGAQAMLAAERRLRELIKSGKLGNVDRILTFEEISSWPYEDGLLGMPKAISKLDDQQVLMTGFMLPIDEVENIKEFLLVESLWSCCYGQPPDINGIVRVVMKGKSRIDYQFEPIKIVGTFEVEATVEDGYCVDIFQLHADSVSVIN